MYRLTKAQSGAWIATHKTPQSVAKRARIIQMPAEGVSNSEIARRTGASRPTVILWRERFATAGTAALSEVRFVEKLTDVVGLCLNPPGKAVVLCVDEKSQIQALDRSDELLVAQRGVFHSVEDLEAAIDEYQRVHNRDPKPFVWTASMQSIIEKLDRRKVISEAVHGRLQWRSSPW